MQKPMTQKPMTAQEFKDALKRLGLVGTRMVAEVLGCDDRTVRHYKAGTLEVPKDVANFLTSLVANNNSGEIADIANLVGSGRKNNTRANDLLTIDGQTLTIAEWARETNISPVTLRRRIKSGWHPDWILMPFPGMTFWTD